MESFFTDLQFCMNCVHKNDSNQAIWMKFTLGILWPRELLLIICCLFITVDMTAGKSCYPLSLLVWKESTLSLSIFSFTKKSAEKRSAEVVLVSFLCEFKWQMNWLTCLTLIDHLQRAIAAILLWFGIFMSKCLGQRVHVEIHHAFTCHQNSKCTWRHLPLFLQWFQNLCKKQKDLSCRVEVSAVVAKNHLPSPIRSSKKANVIVLQWLGHLCGQSTKMGSRVKVEMNHGIDHVSPLSKEAVGWNMGQHQSQSWLLNSPHADHFPSQDVLSTKAITFFTALLTPQHWMWKRMGRRSK